MRSVLVALLVTIGITSARADTTYDYIGGPWTYSQDGPGLVAASPAVFGTNMTGSVTFDIDMTGFTGGTSFSSAGNNLLPEPQLIDLTLTSGTIIADWKSDQIRLADFMFSNGQIVDWWVSSWGVSCGEFYGCQINTMLDGGSQIAGITSQPHVAVFGTAGTWTLDPVSVPAPIIGAGLPGLLLASLFGWWRRKQTR